MLRSVRILLRLARRAADERQAALAEAIRVRDAALAAMTAHTEAVARERAGLVDALQAWQDWAAWATLSERRGRDLTAVLRQAEALEDGARSALREALAELRRLEIVQETAEQAERRAAARRAEAEAEEIELRRPRPAEARGPIPPPRGASQPCPPGSGR